MRLVSIAVAALLAGACGKDDSRPKPPPPKAEELPALAVPPLGIDAIKKMNYVYGDGAKDEVETKRTKIEADGAFGPVDLKQGATIKEIEATWRSRALATSKRDRAYATVQVWGKH